MRLMGEIFLLMWNVRLGKCRTQVNEIFFEIRVFEPVVEVGSQMTYVLDRVKIIWFPINFF